MAKIKDITMLREHALETLEKLANQEIDTAEAGVTGKLCEGVIATVKAQLEYARMVSEEPNIPFMKMGNQKALEGQVLSPKQLAAPKGR